MPMSTVLDIAQEEQAQMLAALASSFCQDIFLWIMRYPHAYTW
jgi:hypothetical protein